jgi:addiction module RelE/StbE family toxin
VSQKKREVKFEPKPFFQENYPKLLKDNPDIKDKFKTFTDAKKEIPPKRLPNGMKDHVLQGKLDGIRECHLSGNILLLYTHANDVVSLLAVCSHDELKTVKKAIRFY